MTHGLRATPKVRSLLRHAAGTLCTLSTEVRTDLVDRAAIVVAKAGTDRVTRRPFPGIDGGLATLRGRARA